jgi:hypothetical protein
MGQPPLAARAAWDSWGAQLRPNPDARISCVLLSQRGAFGLEFSVPAYITCTKYTVVDVQGIATHMATGRVSSVLPDLPSARNHLVRFDDGMRVRPSIGKLQSRDIAGSLLRANFVSEPPGTAVSGRGVAQPHNVVIPRPGSGQCLGHEGWRMST